MKKSEILALVRARDLLMKIEEKGGLSQGGEQSPNAIECIDVAQDINRVLPAEVLADPHYGCVGMCCAEKNEKARTVTKTRHRITVPGRRNELVDLITNKLMDFEKSRARFAHTYPHRTVAERMAVAVIVAEKGEPHLLKPDAHRLDRMSRIISGVHQEFDRDHNWNDGYNHDQAAQHLADCISRAEITR